MSDTNPNQPIVSPAPLGSFLLVTALIAATLGAPASAIAASPLASGSEPAPPPAAVGAQSPTVATSVVPDPGLGRDSAAVLGREVALEADRRDSGWGDSAATLRMILRNAHGEESTRELRAKNLEVADDGDKLLVIFDRPTDVQNTAFLTFTHKEGADDQWLYLPALERVERIASKNKSDPFMGSEFAYEDLTSQEVDKYTYTWLRDETVDGIDLFVVEREPIDENSGYTRQVLWIDKDEYRTWKVDFYDREGDLLKTLRYMGYREYVDEYWRPDLMRMVNHQTGTSTTFEWNDHEFRTGLSERDFDKDSLARVR